jgi:predicted dehydrogenase
MSSSITRRRFIAAASAGAAAAAIRTTAARAADANGRIQIAIVGAGDRGSGLMAELHKEAQAHNAEITAVCDVWKLNRDAAAERVRSWWGKQPYAASRFDEVVSRPDVDAVIVATPDFWHMPVTIAALKAGKDVYVEKPMAVKVDEANEALRLARETSRVVQVGTQRRSDGALRASATVYASGVLGQVSRVSSVVHFNHARWDRDFSNCKAQDVDWDAYTAGTEKRSFDPKLLRKWQLYRLCTNGVAGLWMPHLVDLLHMVTGAKYPACAVSHGGVFVWKDGRETPDTFSTILEYPEGFLFDWSMDLAVAAGGITFNVYGTKATLDVQNGVLIKEAPGRKKDAPEKIKPDPSESHMGNWLKRIRTRERPNADIQYGHQHAIATIMAHEALQSGRRQRWDTQQQQIVTG